MTTTSSSPSEQNGSVRRVVVIGAILLATITLLVVGFSLNQRSAAEEISRARAALDRKDYPRALSLAERSLRLEPLNAKALLIAGQSASGTQDFDKALGYLRQIPDDAGPLTTTAKLETAEILFTHLKRPSKAAEVYRSVLELEPENTLAIHRIAYLLGIGGRNWEVIPYRLQLIRANQASPIDLYLLCDGDSLLQNVDELAEFYQASPEDPLILVGMARQATDRQDFATAEELLRTCLRLSPGDLEAQVKLGELLLEQKRDSDFVAWHSSVSEEIQKHPGYWKLIGNWSRAHSKPREAIRCFWEGLKIDPAQVQSSYQLSQLLQVEDRHEDAERFLDHSKLLERYFTTVSTAWTGENLNAIRQAAELAHSLGMKWEVFGWSSLMQLHHPQIKWPEQMLQLIRPELSALSLDRVVAESNPAFAVDLSNFPLPELNLHESPPQTPDLAESETAATNVRFQDQAAEAGIEMTFYNGAPREHQTRRMYEFNGGGVGVVDFDNDGWPDLYLTQGSDRPKGNPGGSWSDRLYRNLDGIRFVEVSAKSGTTDSHFGGGVTVGDFNNDGLSDLYIANLHTNCFLMNNGDGTFEEITAQTGTAGHEWSSSCLLADLNGDSLPDLYVVNYLGGADVFTRVCAGEGDQPRSCSPRQFPGAQDRLYLNQGEGTFLDITNTSGIELPDGKGLGIVAMSGARAGELNLFVANDAVPNFYLVKSATSPQEQLQFEDQALVSGLAINESGIPEACMGVAAGDANNDGLIDLFVTNFHNESNTLYQQTTDGLFEDSTRANQLHHPSLKMLGFGTQFIDANLNGDLDLIVANGHIDDLSTEGIPFEMPAQFFSNDGQGTFTEVSADSLGPYFKKKILGRGLARLDWNRDGRDDIAVSHLDAPFALLTNKTEDAGHFVSLQLRGTESSRDAIGSLVSVSAGGKHLVRELTAGDGFQASNERRMIIGIGSAETVEKLTIRWPSGMNQKFDKIPVDTELLFIESSSEPLHLPHD
ncbi:FG-GAP-like repeat-containing protein [Thalassoglobus polymorphus]|uniref:Tetratricopeptide repeat protein n=1 Tax=Thalassoglobus polymorphus TaxID=2527994 RepID=A0A517QL36_9PLAN|nr:FG-GAP-like repeat-containing protein [Thalassoglobus polymorphus]QDT32247.1 tetratricopeptide repeat protein [Thalassoglobus polymorphus]